MRDDCLQEVVTYNTWTLTRDSYLIMRGGHKWWSLTRNDHLQTVVAYKRYN